MRAGAAVAGALPAHAHAVGLVHHVDEDAAGEVGLEARRARDAAPDLGPAGDKLLEVVRVLLLALFGVRGGVVVVVVVVCCV